MAYITQIQAGAGIRARAWQSVVWALEAPSVLRLTKKAWRQNS
jgi:hypothetical protein